MPDEPLHQHICKSCAHTFVGIYCNLCGEKVIEPKDRKFKSYFTTVLIATTFVDNKFIKSLWTTIRNPGFLSREYVDGRRVHYMRPLQMFFILNVIYFLFPVLQMFNSSLRTQMYVLPHQKIVHNIIVAKVKAEGISLNGLHLMYNEKTTSYAKLLVVVFILLASIPLSLIFAKRNRYFTDHVALAVELTSFNLAVNAIGLTILFWVINKILHLLHAGGGSYLNDATLTVIFVTTNMYFLFRAAGTFYGQKGKWLVIKAMLGILGLFLALEAYRFILFFITIWSL
jgi:hypothetical protein